MANQDSSTALYNGLHTASFKNSTHRYYVDGKLKPGVTTIMGKVLAKPDLMLWPLNMAMRYLEGKLPAITEADLLEARQAHIKRRDAGAGTGTLVHEIVEKLLLDPTIPAYKQMEALGIDNDEVLLAAHAFESWAALVRPHTTAVEQVVYSHTQKYAGTFDSILEIDGKVYLCDLKTTNASKSAPRGVYAEYFIQLGAYYYAYEEQRQYEIAHGGTALVSIDDLMVISCRKDSKVDTCTATQLGLTLEQCMQLWTSTLFLHNGLADVKKKLARGT